MPSDPKMLNLDSSEKSTTVFQKLTETKKKDRGTAERHGYIHIYSGVPKEERARSGVSIATRKRYKKNIKSWDQINDRILQVQMDLNGHLVTIIVAYDPNDDANVADKDEFNTDMTELLEKISNRKEIIMIGDLNARTGWRVDDPIVGLYGENTLNKNEERLIELCQQNSLKMLNGWFKHKQIHQYTWRQPTPKASSKIINTANTMYETIKKEIHEAAFEALDKQQQPRVKSNELWWYEIVEKLVED
ncbi:hypothetical protein ILUMI_25365 [Ignelater luminosus]|uniref:Endonuclease/exonuclease/phosphatase domain-containing protein n=1 Tax=Ignelater luminosus TaxID=2038154 RepID=A0A8K0C5L6_IGNLU|nr:hypothetical protein ILUMI_25365 [Ignelater luminosus]